MPTVCLSGLEHIVTVDGMEVLKLFLSMLSILQSMLFMVRSPEVISVYVLGSSSDFHHDSRACTHFCSWFEALKLCMSMCWFPEAILIIPRGLETICVGVGVGVVVRSQAGHQGIPPHAIFVLRILVFPTFKHVLMISSGNVFADCLNLLMSDIVACDFPCIM